MLSQNIVCLRFYDDVMNNHWGISFAAHVDISFKSHGQPRSSSPSLVCFLISRSLLTRSPLYSMRFLGLFCVFSLLSTCACIQDVSHLSTIYIMYFHLQIPIVTSQCFHDYQADNVTSLHHMNVSKYCRAMRFQVIICINQKVSVRGYDIMDTVESK